MVLPCVKDDLRQALDRTFDGLSFGHLIRYQHPLRSLPFDVAHALRVCPRVDAGTHPSRQMGI